MYFQDLLGVGLIVPLIPNNVRQMGGNHIQIGLLGSLYAGFQLGSGPLIVSMLIVTYLNIIINEH